MPNLLYLVQMMMLTVKRDIANSVVSAIEDNVPFCVLTDVSYSTIAAPLTQSGCPVAFFSRTLSASEQRYSAVV